MTHLIPVLYLMTSALRRRLGPTEAPAPDPIDHPLLRRMSERELADLPFPRPGEPLRDVPQGTAPGSCLT